MVWPSRGTPVGSLSLFFGGTELTDAAGHVILCGILVWLWYWALRGYLQPSWVLGVGVAVGLGLGIVTELAQVFVPSRGASLLDLLANVLGMGIAAGLVAAGQQWGD
ncbi:MAG: VanZ family protein [Anaerolineae bacterium]|nr:VanZ family protein [Anaerolineae bacterium]